MSKEYGKIRHPVVWFLGCVVICVSVFILSSPFLLRAIVTRSPRVPATNNAKDIYQGIRDFSERYGCPPDESLHEKLGTQGSSADDLLRQMFASGIVADEPPFFLKSKNADTGESLELGDRNIEGDEALSPGENMWAYAPVDRPLDQVSANRPLLLAMLTEKDGKLKALKEAFGDRSVVLRADGSVIPYRVEPSGDVKDNDGVSLFSSESKGWWIDGKPENHAPDIRLPEVKLQEGVSFWEKDQAHRLLLTCACSVVVTVLLIWGWTRRMREKLVVRGDGERGSA